MYNLYREEGGKMEYLKYTILFTIYSTIFSMLLVVIDAIMYPSLLQTLIEKKLPFQEIIKDLYKDFLTNEKTDIWHRTAAKFLNSIASVGVSIGMLLYVLVLVFVYSLLGFIFFQIGTNLFASLFTVLNVSAVAWFFDFFNLLFEIYGFVIVAFIISACISRKYHRYINDRLQIKKKNHFDFLYVFIRILVFSLPHIVIFIQVASGKAISSLFGKLASFVNVINLDILMSGTLPANYYRFSDGNLFMICCILSFVCIILFDISHVKRIASKVNKKIMKDMKKQAKQEQKIKVEEDKEESTNEEIKEDVKEETLQELKEEVHAETKAIFIDLPLDEDSHLDDSEENKEE